MAAGAIATPQEPSAQEPALESTIVEQVDDRIESTNAAMDDALLGDDELAAAGIDSTPDPSIDVAPAVESIQPDPPADLTSPDRFDLAALPPAPIQPGSPQSPYRRCSCIGVMPGRACTRCNNTRWLKVCKDCAGSGIKAAANRLGSMPRRDRCGFCMGVGTTAASMQEIFDASQAWAAYEKSGGKAAHPFADEDGRIARGAKLPTPPPVKKPRKSAAAKK